MSSCQTFRGFVTDMSNNYARYSEGSFMSVNTFTNWFLAWASRMNIDFRQGCRQCGGVSKILACDGTKLGTQFANTSTRQKKRHDRCFLYNPETTKNIYAKHRSDLQIISNNIIKGDENDEVLISSVRDVIPPNCQAAFDVIIRIERSRRLLLASSNCSVFPPL